MSFDICVMPVLAVEDAVATGRYDAVLSVMSPAECGAHSPWPDVGGLPRAVVECADIGRSWLATEQERRAYAAMGHRAPDEADALAIVEFARAAKAEGWHRLLVHCHAAASRSPAAALVLFAVEDGPGAEERSAGRLASLPYCDRALPNLTLVWHADRVLGRGGRLFDACQRRFHSETAKT